MDRSEHSSSQAYFITICTHGRRQTMGEIQGDDVTLNEVGKMVDRTWRHLTSTYGGAAIDEFVIMPNHFHGIVWLNNDSKNKTNHSSNQSSAQEKPIDEFIHSFKSAVTDRANQMAGTQVIPFWQPGFQQHTVHNLPALRRYIHYNPAAWIRDPLNPFVGDASCLITPVKSE